mgnify:CR=1 FL=1
MYFNEAVSSSGADAALPLLYRGLVYAETGDWEKAEKDFLSAADAAGESSVKTVSLFSGNTAREGDALPTRSPLASACLSSVVPGLGQLYCGHWFDSLQAFVTVGVFALATYGVYLYESDNNGSYIYTGILGAVTLTLHSSNIFGAYKTAGYYNLKRKEELLNKIRKEIFTLPPLSSTFLP